MIHRYSLKGKNFLLDVNSGAVHVLDDISYAVSEFIEKGMPEECPEAICQKLPQYSKEQVTDAYAELWELEQNGYLFTEDDYIDVSKYIPVGAPVKALCLHVAHDCNLRCKYCFASTGDFGTGRKIMDFDVAKKAIDFVIAKSGKRRNIEIDFFGGEPLMAFDTVKKTVAYARGLEEQTGKKFRFTITTNGIALNDEIADYINSNMDNVVLSLDGRKEINDDMRPTVNGKGSYDTILPKFQKLVHERSRDRDYYVRGTFTNQNLDFSEDVRHIANAGFDQLSVEPVTLEENLPYALKEEDLPTIFAEYEKLCDLMLEREKAGKSFNFFLSLIHI